MDMLDYDVFTDVNSEYAALQSTNSPIDFTDWPLSISQCPIDLSCNPNFQITSPISDTGYFELEFHMGQNFWGCLFNFGNNTCGTHIRQAFAHGLDKNIFISSQLPNVAVAIDTHGSPRSLTLSTPTPDPCAWDTLFPQTGPGCQVNGAGGTAYHLATATPGNCFSTPSFPWTPGCGTPDFCAAAEHMIAAGLATGKDPTTCVLSGITAAVTASPIGFFARSDNIVRLNAGRSYEQFVCALFTGTFSTGCGGFLRSEEGPITAFPGFTTSTTAVSLTWWVYTAGFGNVFSVNDPFFSYESQFVSGIPSIKAPTGPCSSNAAPSFAPGNYMYLCNAAYDSNIEQAKFAPCLNAPGDPTTGQTHETVTFANCPGTTQVTQASASYKAQDVFGQNAYTIPWWTGSNQFAYLTGWQGAVLNKGNGFTPPGNYFTMLNAWNPSPHVPGTIRQGYSQSTGSVNPFIGNTPWDLGVIGAVWDSPGTMNPDSPTTYLDWMTIRTDLLAPSSLSYTPPPGTVAAFRYSLRHDIFWHTGQKVTAWDLAFSYIAYRVNGVAGGLAPMTGVHVVSPSQVDVLVNEVDPGTKFFLSNPVLPGRDWVDATVCTAAAWDASTNNPNFAEANSLLTNCIAPSSAVTSSGVITPISSNVDIAKIQPSYDPVASGTLIGSGPWMCRSGLLIGGPRCSSSGTSLVPAGGQWTLTRFGAGTVPGGSLDTYFRSAGNLALWAWSGDTGNFSIDFLHFSGAALCFGKPVGAAGCTVWQHGIGGSAAGTVVGLSQISIVARFVGVNWVSPYDWVNFPPQNIVAFPPVLHEGVVTLNPCSIDPVNGYDC